MELNRAVAALSALAQPSRLQVFRLLVKAGPDGIPAGRLATKLKIPANTLSFHLKELTNAGLVRSRKEGRSVIYAMNAKSISRLMSFLTEDCCQGRPELCLPMTCSPSPKDATARLRSKSASNSQLLSP